MTRLTIRISDELHEKLRWLSFVERKSQQVLLEEMLEKALASVVVPEEAKGNEPAVGVHNRGW